MQPTAGPQSRLFLVTGGAGFIGAALSRALVAQGDRVRVLDTMHRGRPDLDDPAIELWKGDVCDRDDVTRAAQGVDGIFHLASVAGVGAVLHNPVRTMRVALLGGLEVLEAAAALPSKPRVVVFSTSEVYGRAATQAIETADTPIGPVTESRWSYACAKIAVEHLAHAFGRERGLPVVSVRPFNVYGPGQVGEGAIHHFIRRALRGEPLVVYNSGEQIRAWTYVSDMVEGTLAAMRSPAAPGHAYNLGSPADSVTVRELADLVAAEVARATGARPPIVHEPRSYPDVETRVPDVEAARRDLGFAPEVRLAEGLARTVAWYRSLPA